MLEICRICLSVDSRMLCIKNTPFQGVFEKVTGLPFVSEGKSQMACFQCVARLKNCHKLIQQARQADKLLTQLLDEDSVVKDKKRSLLKSKNILNELTTSILNNINIVDSIEVEVKFEPEQIKVEVPKQEVEGNDKANNSDVDTTETDTNIKDPQTDSEDDLPLKSISGIKTEKEGPARVRKKDKKQKEKTEMKVDAVEIILTHEQQLSEFRARAQSLNYLNSPYKCDSCYRGFVRLHAFQNHAEKHKESSGHLECPVCRLRYNSTRNLRSHIVTAHERRYACNRCSHQAHTKHQAMEHEKWHEGHTYPCKLCGEQFSKPTSYLTHVRKWHESAHVCGECGESFVGAHGLRMHRTKTHRGGDQKKVSDEPLSERCCKDCDIQFHSALAWKRHILTSIKHALWNDNTPECRICKARVSPGMRRAHMRAHMRSLRPAAAPLSEPLAMLACEQCDAQFVSRSRLQAHVKRIHLGVKYNKNVVCEVCGKRCTSNATLRYHQRRHTGERPYGCGCGAAFRDANQLRLHARTHSGERPYACPLCPKRFSQKPALNRHHRVHTGAKPYECQFCSKTFSQSNSMKLHVKTVHLKMPQHKKGKAIAQNGDKGADVPLSV